MIFTAFILLSGGLVTYAATNLFTQSVPGQTFNSAFLIGKCSSLVLEPSLSNIPLAGNAGFLAYDCGTSAAFIANPAGSGPATPTFNVPTGWTLGVSPVSSDCSPQTTLTSGTAVTLTLSSGYLYCLTTTSATNFTSFSILWTQ
jgi:hypothetical protein